MASRAPGQLIVLPSARLHWHRERMRRRKKKVVLASVAVLGLLAGFIDVIMDSDEPPRVTTGAEARPDEGADMDEAPHPVMGKHQPRQDTLGSTWLSTSGEDAEH